MIQSYRLARVVAPAFFLASFAAMSVGTAPVAEARDVPYVPTPPEAVQTMLEMANVQPDDLLYDLGSGDGRIVIAAIRDFGVKRAIGIDIDPERIAESQANAKKEGVEDRAEFKEGDIFTEDFRDADVITMYLLSRVNLRLRPRLLNELRPGTRLVSHQFSMGEWEPDAEETAGNRTLYYWVVPAKVEGDWQVEGGDGDMRLSLTQEFQKVSGTVTAYGQTVPIDEGRLDGENFVFQANATRDGRPVPLRFEGRVAGEAGMEGELTLDGSASTVRIARVQ